MAIYSVSEIAGLEKLLREKVDRLIEAMNGDEVSETDMRAFDIKAPMRNVSKTDLILSIDCCNSILKLIKKDLGK
jgi:hypothetical protein